MRSDAFIVVTCDQCRGAVEIQLTTTARGYDERNIDDELTSLGWSVEGDQDLCEECKKDDR
jgi:hypothetical protein